MNCQHCGHKTAEENNYCSNCGYNINDIRPSAALTQKDQSIKAYDVAIQRLEDRLEDRKVIHKMAPREGFHLFAFGMGLSAVYILYAILRGMEHSDLISWVESAAILIEAGLPLAASFFLRKPAYRNALMGVGFVVIAIAIYSVFSPFLGG